MPAQGDHIALDPGHGTFHAVEGREADLRNADVGRLHGGLSGRFGRGFGRGFGGGRRRAGILHRQGEAHELHAGIVDGAVGGDGVHEQGVDLALLHQVGADAGLLVGGVGGEHDPVALVVDLHAVAGHLALGVPVQGGYAGLEVADAALFALDGLDGDHWDADMADVVGGLRLGRMDAAHAQRGAGHVRGVAVLGIGGDPQRVDLVILQGGHRHAQVGEQDVAVHVDHAVGIGDAGVEGLDVALHTPGEVGRLGGIVVDVEDVVLAVMVGVQGDHRHADDGGLDVHGRVVREQQLLRAHGGHAAGGQADLLLEQGDGVLGGAAVVAGGAAGHVVQRDQALLQGQHAAVLVAAAQYDEAGGLGGVFGEQRLLHGDGGVAGLGQARGALEHADGGGGVGGVGAAHAALQIIELLEPVVQLAHAIAGVVAIEVDVGGAAVGAVGVQGDQRVAGRAVVHGQTVLRLEQLHGLLGAAAVDAVGFVGHVAQIAQPFLQDLHPQAARAAIERHIGIIGIQAAGEDQALQLGVGDAVHFLIEIALQQAHRVLGAGSKDAVHLVIIVAQVQQRLLDGAHRVAAAAAGEGGVLRGGLEQIPGLFLAVHAELFQEHEPGFSALGVGLKFDEAERRLVADLFKLGVHVQLAAHALDAQAGELEVGGQAVGGQIAEVVELLQRAGLQVDLVEDVVRGQDEQPVLRGRQLAGQAHLGGRHDLPGHGLGVIRLEAHGAAGVGEVVDPVVHGGEGHDVGIHMLRGVAAGRAHVEAAVAGGEQLVFLGQTARAGPFAGVDLEVAGLGHENHRAGVVHQLKDQALAGDVQALDGLVGRVGVADEEVRHALAHQLRAVLGEDVIQIVAQQRRGIHVAQEQRFGVVFKVDHVKVASFGILRRGAEIQHAIGVDGQHALRFRLVDRILAARQEQAARAVHIGGQRAVARHGLLIRQRRAAQQQRQREDDCAKSLHFISPSCEMMFFRRCPRGIGSHFMGWNILPF